MEAPAPVLKTALDDNTAAPGYLPDPAIEITLPPVYL